MLMPPFHLHHPSTIEEACELAAGFLETKESFDWAVSYTHLTLPTTPYV